MCIRDSLYADPGQQRWFGRSGCADCPVHREEETEPSEQLTNTCPRSDAKYRINTEALRVQWTRRAVLSCFWIKCRVDEIDIFLVQAAFDQLNGLAEALKMHNFPFSQEADHVVYIRVVR